MIWTEERNLRHTCWTGEMKGLRSSITFSGPTKRFFTSEDSWIGTTAIIGPSLILELPWRKRYTIRKSQCGAEWQVRSWWILSFFMTPWMGTAICSFCKKEFILQYPLGIISHSFNLCTTARPLISQEQLVSGWTCGFPMKWIGRRGPVEWIPSSMLARAAHSVRERLIKCRDLNGGQVEMPWSEKILKLWNGMIIFA